MNRLALFCTALLTLAMASSCTKTDEKELTPHIEYTLDASNPNVWVYYSLRDAATVGTGDTTSTSASEWAERSDWDIAFKTFNIRTNSGTSGKGKGGVHICPSEVSYSALTAMPADTLFKADTLHMTMDMGKGGMVEMSRSEATSVNLKMKSMPPLYEPTNVYIVRTADGKEYYKMWFYGYKNDQDKSGHLKFNMAKL